MQVDPETVGQFTGVRDNRKTKIYEGDVLNVDGDADFANCTPPAPKGKHVGRFLVETEMTNWGYETSWRSIRGYECSTHIMGDTDEEGVSPNAEVIGNIYDNPELLD